MQRSEREKEGPPTSSLNEGGGRGSGEGWPPSCSLSSDERGDPLEKEGGEQPSFCRSREEEGDSPSQRGGRGASSLHPLLQRSQREKEGPPTPSLNEGVEGEPLFSTAFPSLEKSFSRTREEEERRKALHPFSERARNEREREREIEGKEGPSPLLGMRGP